MSTQDTERFKAQRRPRRAYGIGETPSELAEILAAELELRLDKKAADHES